MFKRLLCLFSFVYFSPFVNADTLIFQVEDENGKPLPNAVIIAGKPGEAGEAKHEVAIMDQVNKTFVPHVLAIEKGTSVEFPNKDQIRHQVYSFSKPKVFQINLYAGKPDSPISFNSPGIEVLGCNIHDSMIGYIVISDTPYWGQSGSDGIIKINMASIPSTIRIWHPRQLEDVNQMQTIPTPQPSKEGGYLIKLPIKPKHLPAQKFMSDRFRYNE